ncbi:MAG: ComF family protein [Clostridia bacterium]|nr:ComF family protein [Clostridia bacterium]
MDILSFFDRNEYTKCITCGQLMKTTDFFEVTGKTGICKACNSHLPIVPVGTTFQEHRSYIEYCMAAFFYRAPLRQTIIDFKFKSCISYADIFSKYMYIYLSSVIDEDDSPELIVPVPLSAERMKERGYNQAELLSRPLAEMLCIPHSTECIKRIRNTKRQSDLLPRHRGANIENAFAAESTIAENKSILLIDDVYTTGSTVRECAKTLVEAGARKVRVFTLARQPGMRKSKEYHDLLSQ